MANIIDSIKALFNEIKAMSATNQGKEIAQKSGKDAMETVSNKATGQIMQQQAQEMAKKGGIKGFINNVANEGGKKFTMDNAMQLGGAIMNASSMFGSQQQTTNVGAGQRRGYSVAQHSTRRRIA